MKFGMKHTVKERTRDVLRTFGYEPVPQAGAFRLRKVPAGRRTVHYLHIGKNAGTKVSEIVAAVNSQTPEVQMIKHSHHVALGAIPDGDPYFFSIRNPMKRFFSGFYSRKRKGQPRFYAEWSPHEEQAFAAFEHANDLAEALYEDSDAGHKAFAAIRSIQHLSANQVDWFTRHGFFLDLRPPI